MAWAEAIVDRFDEGAKQNIHKANAFQTSFLTCHYHNTKPVHVQLPQSKTCTHTTITIQNM
jgi:hypothetical protein